MWYFKFLSFVILWVSSASANPDATITLYDVSYPTDSSPSVPTISQGISYSASPIGVGPGGETTYAEVKFITTEVLANAETTQTTDFTPTATITVTLAEDSKGLKETYSSGGPVPIVFSKSCSFDGTTNAECREMFAIGTEAPIRTTYTGVPMPFYTFVESSEASKRWKNSFEALSGIAALVTGIIVAGGI
ncbi:hypothetical protein D9756_010811 [Leucocoprinus leucothites]|uniref:Uncharacterized protein n=1 Tax=Leucocoprinus leucothites TaxID=201217 RepID=A0A8H5CR52_9AGAR|nr:hypothetical protein D9756_010811 [Leucoagaricus leucothites]